jgi:hypothetical protein
VSEDDGEHKKDDEPVQLEAEKPDLSHLIAERYRLDLTRFVQRLLGRVYELAQPAADSLRRQPSKSRGDHGALGVLVSIDAHLELVHPGFLGTDSPSQLPIRRNPDWPGLDSQPFGDDQLPAWLGLSRHPVP